MSLLRSGLQKRLPRSRKGNEGSRPAKRIQARHTSSLGDVERFLSRVEKKERFSLNCFFDRYFVFTRVTANSSTQTLAGEEGL